jgi:hypothetical protein
MNPQDALEDAYVTVLILDSGDRVRASETLEYVESWYAEPRPSGLIEVTDPGDERKKLVPVDRIAFVESEAA